MKRDRMIFGLLSVVVLVHACTSDRERPRSLESILPQDTLGPEILLFSPAVGDTFVPVRGPISVRFSEDIDAATVTPESFIITPSIPDPRTVCRTAVACTVWTRLDYSQDYSVTLTQGIKDMAGNSISDGLTWSFRTRPPPPPPILTGFSPTVGFPGMPVTLLGTGFDTIWSENVVWFTGDSTSVISSTDTTILTVVPMEATTGPIMVRNQIAYDTSDADFEVLPTDVTVGGTHHGQFMITQNFDTDSAITLSQWVVITWSPSYSYMMRLDWTKQPPSERVFCDVGARFHYTTGGIVLQMMTYFSNPLCDTTTFRNPDGYYGSSLINDTLYMYSYQPQYRLLKRFVLTQP